MISEDEVAWEKEKCCSLSPSPISLLCLFLRLLRTSTASTFLSSSRAWSDFCCGVEIFKILQRYVIPTYPTAGSNRTRGPIIAAAGFDLWQRSFSLMVSTRALSAIYLSIGVGRACYKPVRKRSPHLQLPAVVAGCGQLFYSGSNFPYLPAASAMRRPPPSSPQSFVAATSRRRLWQLLPRIVQLPPTLTTCKDLEFIQSVAQAHAKALAVALMDVRGSNCGGRGCNYLARYITRP